MYILDRFEGDKAVIEYSDAETLKMLAADRKKLSPGAREGDVLTASGDGFITDTEKTAERKAELRKKLENLTGRTKG